MMRRFVARHRTGVAVSVAGVIAVIAVTAGLLRSGQPDDEVSAPEPEEPVAEEPSVEEPDPWRMPLTGVPTDELPDRPVDTQVISGFGRPGFAYSGARPEVRAMLAQTRAVAITEGAPGFFRDDGVYASHPVAPHNLFVRADQALTAVSEAGALPLDDIGWVFAEEPEAVGAQASSGTTIDIEMSTSYRTSWAFEPETGLYRRSQNGVPSAVTGPGRIGAANVVVVQADRYVGMSGYPETNVAGEGVAVVLRDGNRYPARWSKPTATDPLLILAVDGGTTFLFKPGPTWIHLPDQLPEEVTS